MIGQGKSFRVIDNKNDISWFKLMAGDIVKLNKQGLEYASEGSDMLRYLLKDKKLKVESIIVDEYEKTECNSDYKNNCACYRYITVSGCIENLDIKIKSLNLCEIDILEIGKNTYRK